MTPTTWALNCSREGNSTTFKTSACVNRTLSNLPPNKSIFLFFANNSTDFFNKSGCSASATLVDNTQVGPVTKGSKLANLVSRKAAENTPDFNTVSLGKADPPGNSPSCCLIWVNSLTVKLLCWKMNTTRLFSIMSLYLLWRNVRLGGWTAAFFSVASRHKAVKHKRCQVDSLLTSAQTGGG